VSVGLKLKWGRRPKPSSGSDRVEREQLARALEAAQRVAAQ